MKQIGTVYMLKNTTNGKVYVGSTSHALEHRVRQHMYALKGGYHNNKEMQADFNKGHEFIAQALGEKRRLTEEERYWMKILRTYDERFGYNNHDHGMNGVRKNLGLPYQRSKRKGRSFPQIKQEP